MSELTTQEKESSDDLEPISEASPSKTLDEDHESSSDDNDETLGDDDAIDQADDVVDPEAAGANENNDNNPTTNLQTLDTANANSIDFRNVTDNDNNIPVSGYFLYLSFSILIKTVWTVKNVHLFSKPDFCLEGPGFLKL